MSSKVLKSDGKFEVCVNNSNHVPTDVCIRIGCYLLMALGAYTVFCFHIY